MAIDVANLLERFKEFDALRADDGVRTGEVERVRPRSASAWPSPLHPSIRAALDGIGMGMPYSHQFDAVAKSLNGADVVLESPTASGTEWAKHASTLVRISPTVMDLWFSRDPSR